MTETLFEKIEIEKLPHSEAEIRGEVSATVFDESYLKALKKTSEGAEIPGFRKGHVPEKILVEKIGSNALLHEAAEIAIARVYGEILKTHNLDAIGRPEIAITKLARHNPLGFKIKTALLPAVNLPDYKAIASKEMATEEAKPEVSEKEIEEIIEQLRKNVAGVNKMKKEKAGEKAEIEEPLPVADDEFAKMLGDYKSLDDLKDKIKENLLKEKEMKAREKKRVSIAEVLIQKTEIDLPEILITSEQSKMLAQLKDDVSRQGVSFENYLKQIKKTEEDIRVEWRPAAEKKSKMQLILNTIAQKENLTAEKSIVLNEVKRLKEIYKDANPDGLQIFIETQLTNEKVFQFLENSVLESESLK